MALRVFASQAASALRMRSRSDRLFLLRHFSSKFPEDLKYAESHEWVKVDGEYGTVGLTSFAVAGLGDVVYVGLPKVGSTYEPGEIIGTVEPVKASHVVYAPVGGEVSEVNTSLRVAAWKVQRDPFGQGWLLKLKLSDSKHLDSLLSADAYQERTEKEKH